MLASHIEAAEQRLQHTRGALRASCAATGRVVHARLCSPRAHLVALAAGLAWGLRPECRDVDTRGGTRVRKAMGVAARAALSRIAAGLFA